ncbi:hypothetical protein OYE22_22055 [Streptomyces sp. 71268]|uniref:hypothetical protein n=1 Tax=Streptomyces sp. 71268 TaxID=3002640 RepID=UPI0023F9BC33|nr:hypothetical protein [Streptomyces sp. 71268]WEV27568.1 hypothetical protein OYE22_22055 [Streptomyces sp. 71268]
MPRPTPAQLVYGSATVVLSTLAMLLLSEVRSGAGVAVIAVAGLALGLLVAVTVPIPRPTPASSGRAADSSPVTRLPLQRSEPRATEHSLHS